MASLMEESVLRALKTDHASLRAGRDLASGDDLDAHSHIRRSVDFTSFMETLGRRGLSRLELDEKSPATES